MPDLIFLLFTGITIGFSGAMIPGPLTLFTASETLKTNRFSGFKIISGHMIAEFFLMLVIFLGAQRFLSSETFLFIVSIVGGLALIIMGAVILLNVGRMRLSDVGTNSGFNKGLVIGGIFFSITSPGFIVWWATIGVSTIMKAMLLFGIMGVVILSIGHWLADVTWYGFMSYAVDKGKAYLTDKVYQNVVRVFSGLLIFLGIYFLIA